MFVCSTSLLAIGKSSWLLAVSGNDIFNQVTTYRIRFTYTIEQ